MRIATWNVNSLPARLPRLLSWLESVEPDVVVLQETKIAQEAFPTDEVAAAGYESVHRGQGRWNGVALLSRVGITELETDIPGVPGFPGPEDRAGGALHRSDLRRGSGGGGVRAERAHPAGPPLRLQARLACTPWPGTWGPWRQRPLRSP